MCDMSTCSKETSDMGAWYIRDATPTYNFTFAGVLDKDGGLNLNKNGPFDILGGGRSGIQGTLDGVLNVDRILELDPFGLLKMLVDDVIDYGRKDGDLTILRMPFALYGDKSDFATDGHGKAIYSSEDMMHEPAGAIYSSLQQMPNSLPMHPSSSYAHQPSSSYYS